MDDEDVGEDPWCLRGSSQVARPNQTSTWELGIGFVLRRVWKVKRILAESFFWSIEQWPGLKNWMTFDWPATREVGSNYASISNTESFEGGDSKLT